NPGELVGLHPLDHVLERVFFVGMFAVRVDPDKTDTPFPELFGCLTGYLVGTHNVRAVVACEKDHQHFRVVKIGKGVGFSICRGKCKVRSNAAEREGKLHKKNLILTMEKYYAIQEVFHQW